MSNPEQSPRDLPEGYCLDCAYPLRGLERPRCPECGGEFDPDDPVTYSKSPRIPRSGATMLVLAIVGLAMLIAASIRLNLEPIKIGHMNRAARVFLNWTLWPGLLLHLGIVAAFVAAYIRKRHRFGFLGWVGFEIAGLTVLFGLANYDWIHRGPIDFLGDVLRAIRG